jgi:hypothetical protein
MTPQTDNQSTDDKPLAGQSDEDIIADARNYLELCQTANGENIREGITDLNFLAGNHWPETSKRERALDGRPCLTINKLPTFLQQVTNSQRQNRASTKVSPVGSGADIPTAEVRQGIIKHIEYISNADVATDTAVNSAAAIGFGYYRIMPEYESDKSFDQVLAYKRIRNPFTVAFDPGSQEPDGSDQKKCLIHIEEDKKSFQLQYPNAKIENTALPNASATVVQWSTNQYIRLGEFYRIEQTPAELVRMSDGGVFWADEITDAMKAGLTKVGIYEMKRRSSFKTKVMWYKLTYHEILERTEIMCRWIPVFPVFGTEIDLNGKIVRRGLIRDARDPQLMYDYWMTAATEEVALRTKTPFVMAEGQDEGHANEWQQANTRSFPTLKYKPTTVDGLLVPPPQRQPMTDIPSGMLSMAMHANDNIKGTTGLFDSSLGAQGTATSGVQERAQQHQGNISNFHYQDGLVRTRRHSGRCLMDMIPHYYDTERIVRIMRDDGKAIEAVPINKKLEPREAEKLAQDRNAKSEGRYTVAAKEIMNDMTGGDYAAVIDSGPSFDTQRKEAAEAMIQFGQAWPKLMDVAGDEVVQAMDWPGAQRIARRIERTIPKEIKYDPDDPNAGPPPLPPEVEQKLKEQTEVIAGLQEEVKKLESGVDVAKIKADSDRVVAEIKAANAETVAEIQREAKENVEEIKGYVEFLLLKLAPPEPLKSEAELSMGA